MRLAVATIFSALAMLLLLRPPAAAQRLACERAHHRTPDTLCQWVDNPILLEDYRGDCGRLTARAARGRIRRDTLASGACRFLYTCPASVAGFDTIIVEARGSGRTQHIATGAFPIKPFPTPVVELANKAEGTLYKAVLQAQSGIVAPSDDRVCNTIHNDRIAHITGYRMEVWRGQNVVFEERVADGGGLFPERASAFFESRIQAGERLRIFGIRLLIYREEERAIPQELWFDIR